MGTTGSRDGASQQDKFSLKQIWTVLGMALLARGMVLWFVLRHFHAEWFFHRGMEMGFLGQSIIQGKGLGSPFGYATGPTALIAPGYPLFVAGIFALFGAFSTTSAAVLMATQIALNLLTILLVMRLSARFANHSVAVLTGLFWALFPSLIWLPTIFWDTSFSCFIVVAGVAGALRLTRSASRRGFLLAGILIALVALVNPALLPTLLALLIWTAYRCRKQIRYGIVYASIALALVFSPWPIRNAGVFHAFIPFRSTVGLEMWMGNRPNSKGYLDESLFPTFNPSELRAYVKMGEVAYVNQKSAEARQYIFAQPARFSGLSLRRVARFWTGSGTLDGSLVFVLHACVTSLGGLLGVWFLLRQQPDIGVLALLPLIVFPLPYYITHAEFRYRLVIDPWLTVLSAIAIARLAELSQGRISGRETG